VDAELDDLWAVAVDERAEVVTTFCRDWFFSSLLKIIASFHFARSMANAWRSASIDRSPAPVGPPVRRR
jgi:hypothetical protein